MKLMPFTQTLLCALAMLGAGASGHAESHAPAPSYSLVDLGTLGGSFSSAAAINNKRQIVGRSSRNDRPECLGAEEDTPCEFAFLWQLGQMTDLGHANPNGLRTYPGSINQQGVIAGFEEVPALHGGGTSAVVEKPFVYSHGGFRALPLLSGSDDAYGLAYGINGAGVITGFSQTRNKAQLLVTWRNEVVERGAAEAGTYRRGLGINNQGMIVGWQYLPQSFRPNNGFVDDRGVVSNLSAADTEIWSEAMDVNNAGLVVGNKADAAFQAGLATEWRLVRGRWTSRRIGALKGHDHSSLNRVNRDGDSVGFSEDSANGVQRAIAVLDGRLVDLTAMMQLANVELKTATGINDQGDIVGEASFNGGAPRAYLLIRR